MQLGLCLQFITEAIHSHAEELSGTALANRAMSSTEEVPLVFGEHCSACAITCPKSKERPEAACVSIASLLVHPTEVDNNLATSFPPPSAHTAVPLLCM